MTAARSRFWDRFSVPEPLRGGDRNVKAAFTAGASTLGTVIAHVAGGAPPPNVALILIAIGISVLVAVPLSGRAVSLTRLAVVVFASQALFHLFFIVAEPSSTTQAMTSMPGHEGHLVSTLAGSTPLLSDHALHMTPAMLSAHAIAGLATLVALHSGERILQRLVNAARDAWRTLRIRISALIVVLTATNVGPHPTLHAAWPRPARHDDLVYAWSGTRRGPPALA